MGVVPQKIFGHFAPDSLYRNPPHTLLATRLLLFWYFEQKVGVCWNNFSYKKFTGVCQRGVLSPILFTIYINDLDELEKAGVGCHWNQPFCWCLLLC